MYFRNDFSYENTPSSDLCLTLVDLIVSHAVAAEFLLDCCHSLSLQLVSHSQSQLSREVDHYFIIRSAPVLIRLAPVLFGPALILSGWPQFLLGLPQFLMGQLHFLSG